MNPRVTGAGGIVSTTGTWGNSGYGVYGLNTCNVGATMTAQGFGRFIVIGTDVLAAGSSPLPTFTVVLNGTAVFTSSSMASAYYATETMAWIYDTGVTGNYTLVLTVNAGACLEISFLSIFPVKPANARPVLLQRITPQNQGGWGTNTTSIFNLNYQYDVIAKRMRTTYGLPVFTVEHGNVGVDAMSHDGLHPNQAGHAVMASNILKVIANPLIIESNP